MKIKVAIVEDNRAVREELALQVNGADELMCVAEMSSAEEAIEGLPFIQPDVVLLDIELAGKLTGLDCIEPLKEKLPDVQIIMLTIFNQPEKVFAAIQLGAVGYIQKSSSRTDLVGAVRDVCTGGAPMSPEIARLVLSSCRSKTPAFSEMQKLTSREQEVATLAAQGWMHKEIADHLGISSETVKSHTKNLYEKLNVRNKGSVREKLFPGGFLNMVSQTPMLF